MNYLSIKEVAEKWNLNVRSVQKYCMNGKIPGAKNIGRQWLIPSTAVPPLDGRTKSAKKGFGRSAYHFPVFIYSPLYNFQDQLEKEERQLLQAQLLHFEGDYSESILLCRQVLEHCHISSVAAGAYLMIGLNAILLGLHTEYKSSVAQLQQYCTEDPVHAEDLKLITAFLRYHTEWDPTPIESIDPDKLSPDAIIFYKYSLLLVTLLCGKQNPDSVLKYLQSDCIQLTREGLTPALLTFSCLLGIGYSFSNKPEEGKLHTELAVRLAMENNWTSHLIKFCAFNTTMITAALKPYGSSHVRALKEKQMINSRNWNFIHEIETDIKRNSLFSNFQGELLLLISYGLSNQEIASIKKLPVSRINEELRALYQIAEVSSKPELVKYAKAMFKCKPPQTEETAT